MKSEKKKKPSLVWIIAIIVLISALSEGDEDVFFGLIIIAAVAAVLTLVVRAVKRAKNNSAIPGNTAHSHDRLSRNTLRIEAYDSFEHYKRQIDGFLAAGIIDRAEYKVLYEKYKRTLR